MLGCKNPIEKNYRMEMGKLASYFAPPPFFHFRIIGDTKQSIAKSIKVSETVRNSF